MFPILWKGDNTASILPEDFLQRYSLWFPFSPNLISLCSTTLWCVNLAWNRVWRQKRPLWSFSLASSRIFLRDSCMRLHDFSCQGNNSQSFPSLTIPIPPSHFVISCYNKKSCQMSKSLALASLPPPQGKNGKGWWGSVAGSSAWSLPLILGFCAAGGWPTENDPLSCR